MRKAFILLATGEYPEYRYLVGMNSYFFVFTDLGFTTSKSSYGDTSNRLLGLGLAWLSKQRPGFQSFIGSRKKK
jgi:hypothetical protein